MCVCALPESNCSMLAHAAYMWRAHAHANRLGCAYFSVAGIVSCWVSLVFVLSSTHTPGVCLVLYNSKQKGLHLSPSADLSHSKQAAVVFAWLLLG